MRYTWVFNIIYFNFVHIIKKISASHMFKGYVSLLQIKFKGIFLIWWILFFLLNVSLKLYFFFLKENKTKRIYLDFYNFARLVITKEIEWAKPSPKKKKKNCDIKYQMSRHNSFDEMLYIQSLIIIYSNVRFHWLRNLLSKLSRKNKRSQNQKKN